MKGFTRTWKQSNHTKQYTHTLTIYDSGDRQGFLLQNTSNTNWFLFQVVQRSDQSDHIQETGIVQEGEIPFEFFSTETYPAAFTQSSQALQIWIPEWSLLTSFHAQALDSSAQMHQRSQQQQQLSPLRQQQQNQPALPAPGRSHCSRPRSSQQNERNKRNTLPTPTSSPSSNLTSHAQQPGPNPRKPVSHHPRPASKNQHHSQPKLSSRPDKSTSVSADQTNSG